MIVKVKNCEVSWMCKTDSAKQHFCGSITHVEQYVLLCLLLADSFKTLKHILLNTAEDIPALQAFLLFFQVKLFLFCGAFIWRTARTHTHAQDFSATLTLNESNRTIFYSYCSQWQYLKLIWNQPLIWSNIFDSCYAYLFFSLLSLWLLKNIVVFSANNLGLLFPHIFPYIDGEEWKWVSAGVKSQGLIWLKHRYIFSLPCYKFLFHSYLKLFANFDSIYKCPAFWLWGYLFV